MISATSAGFVLAFVPSSVFAPPAPAIAAKQFEPTVWYSISSQGVVTINVAEAEMGQHIGTALARIIAEELEVEWRHVRLNYIDSELNSESKFGYRLTGGSWSVWQNFDLLSRAGAAGRRALIEEGARLLGVSPFACRAQDSRVINDQQSVSYAEIVQQGDLTRIYSDTELAEMPIKEPRQRKLVGYETRALDIPDKVRGTAIYGIDASVPGMVFGKPLLPPTRYGSKIRYINDAAAKKIKGYHQTLVLDDLSGSVPGWALVIADSYHAALRAAKEIEVEWEAGETAGVSEQDILDHGAQLIDSDAGALVVDDPEVDLAFGNAANVLTRRYTTSTALHFQMEPVNALAFEKAGRWELHCGNQWQSLSLPVYAKALGVPEEKIVMRTYLLGGGFGRRLNGDYGVPALLAARALGKPVKVVFSRDDDSRFDSPRSASVQEVSMAFSARNKVIGMQHHAVAGWPTQELAPFFMVEGRNGQKYDPFSINGADHWYSVGAHRIRAISNDLASKTFRPGWLRSAGPGWTNWALESFLDEAALSVGTDPVSFRLQLLISRGKNAGSWPSSVSGAARLANVLKRVSKKAGWGKKLTSDTAMGVATTSGQDRDMPTWCACIAQVHVDRKSGKISVQKINLVIDAGIIVHPDGALAQTEGAALWGVSLALFEAAPFENGQVKFTNLDRYKPLRMADVPELDIEFAASDFSPVGLGEPATTVVGPAIGNAIYAAVGIRLRHLPMTSEAVLQALSG